MLKEAITEKEIKMIFSDIHGKEDKELKKNYLKRLFKLNNINVDIEESHNKLNQQIISTWQYEKSKQILRKMFFETNKYKYGISRKEKIDYELAQWKNLGLGDVKWPFSANNIDDYVHHLNRREDRTDKQKDESLAEDIIKFRRMKQISSLRNDYIESLIVKYNDDIIPTFGNKRGIDFYISGYAFDQKVSKSVGKNFIQKYGEDNYRTVAIDNPEALAESLYSNQDESRFGCEPRLLIVCLDEDVSTDDIEKILKESVIGAPLKIDFTYNKKHEEAKKYTTECYVVLLHK